MKKVRGAIGALLVFVILIVLALMPKEAASINSIKLRIPLDEVLQEYPEPRETLDFSTAQESQITRMALCYDTTFRDLACNLRLSFDKNNLLYQKTYDLANSEISFYEAEQLFSAFSKEIPEGTLIEFEKDGEYTHIIMSKVGVTPNQSIMLTGSPERGIDIFGWQEEDLSDLFK